MLAPEVLLGSDVNSLLTRRVLGIICALFIASLMSLATTWPQRDLAARSLRLLYRSRRRRERGLKKWERHLEVEELYRLTLNERKKEGDNVIADCVLLIRAPVANV